MHYFIYNNGDARNHGCEAIIRSTSAMLGVPKECIVYTSFDIDADKLYNVDEICNILDCRVNSVRGGSLKYYILRGLSRLGINCYTRYIFSKLFANLRGWDLGISVGGDNYCYKNAVDNLSYINKRVLDKIPKIILWGVSIEPALLSQPKVLKDIKRYYAIFCRESITYEALKNCGVKNLYLYPDPAFTLKVQEAELPQGFIAGNTIGINVSPLVEALGNGVYDNYRMLIKYILENTNCAVALIPHVVTPGNDDRDAENRLYEEFKSTGRMVKISDMNCMQLKWVISQCRFFIGARTHATIAAYSTCVPTLVVGYSVKAKGIAKDIFGAYEGYVLSVQEMKDASDLTNVFIRLFRQEGKISEHLESFMPAYIQRAYEGAEKLKSIK